MTTKAKKVQTKPLSTPPLPAKLLKQFNEMCAEYHLDREKVLARFVETGVESTLEDSANRIDLIDVCHIKPAKGGAQ